MSKQQETVGQKIAEGIGCGAMIALVVMGFIAMCTFQIESAKQIAKDLQNDLTTERGVVFGKVQKVETWKDEKFVHKEGRMTVTLDITDRCRVTFTDGRSKEMIGMPKNPIPTDKEVAVTWAKYDLFLDAVDAEEYRKKKPPPKPEGQP